MVVQVYNNIEESNVVVDRKIASKRIHVERVVGLAKTYKILKIHLQYHCLHLANRIINVCLKLTLFRRGCNGLCQATLVCIIVSLKFTDSWIICTVGFFESPSVSPLPS